MDVWKRRVSWGGFSRTKVAVDLWEEKVIKEKGKEEDDGDNHNVEDDDDGDYEEKVEEEGEEK